MAELGEKKMQGERRAERTREEKCLSPLLEFLLFYF